jgi:hypothetical protein
VIRSRRPWPVLRQGEWQDCGASTERQAWHGGLGRGKDGLNRTDTDCRSQPVRSARPFHVRLTAPLIRDDSWRVRAVESRPQSADLPTLRLVTRMLGLGPVARPSGFTPVPDPARRNPAPAASRSMLERLILGLRTQPYKLDAPASESSVRRDLQRPGTHSLALRACNTLAPACAQSEVENPSRRRAGPGTPRDQADYVDQRICILSHEACISDSIPDADRS